MRDEILNLLDPERTLATEASFITDELWDEHRATFEKRGVSREVAERRPYRRYEEGERELADELFDSIPPRQRGSTVTRRVNYSGGWIMVRHPAGTERPILAEFGPADKLEPTTTWHDHTWPPRWVKHIGGRKHGLVNVEGLHEHAELEEPHRHDSVSVSAVYGPHINGARSGHRGESPEGPHPHDKTKKYLFGPKPWAFQPYMRAEHQHGARGLEKWHPEGGDPGEHQHVKYDKVPESYARRLDVHPDTWAMLPGASRVFWSIEGVLKNDALVTAGEAAFNVPSVWQTAAPELEDFAVANLVGKTVFIVPDSDWASNPEVSFAAFTAQRSLGRILGERFVKVAAPTPEPAWCSRHGKEVCEAHDNWHCEELECRKRGVDDYLADEGSVAGMQILARRISPTLFRWCQRYRVTPRPGTYANGRERNAEVLIALALLANEHGCVSRREKAIARFLGWGPRADEKVRRAIDALHDFTTPDLRYTDLGDPTFFGSPFDLSSGYWGSLRRSWKGDWEAAPVMVIREDLRAGAERLVLEA